MILDFAIAVLATWRIASLLTREDGPYRVFARLRQRGEGGLLSGLPCLYCVSLWVAAPLTRFIAPWSVRSLVIWLSLSGGACLLDRATQGSIEIAPLDERPHVKAG